MTKVDFKNRPFTLTTHDGKSVQTHTVIIATGAIEYPPEYQAMMPESLSRLGISKTMTITSTYDPRLLRLGMKVLW